MILHPRLSEIKSYICHDDYVDIFQIENKFQKHRVTNQPHGTD